MSEPRSGYVGGTGGYVTARLSDDECVWGRDGVCQRTDERHVSLGHVPAPVILAPGEVWCERCEWEHVGGTEAERTAAFFAHVRTHETAPPPTR